MDGVEQPFNIKWHQKIDLTLPKDVQKLQYSKDS